MVRVWAGLGFLLSVAPAFAEGPMQVMPVRDVDVTYQAPVPNSENTMLLQRMRFSTLLRRQRLDMPTSGHWILRDLAARSMSVVSDSQKSVVRVGLPPDAGEMNLAPGEHWVLNGKVNIAGYSCNDWQVAGTNQSGDTICLTDDGVTLRSTHGSRVVMQAVTLNYAPQPGDIFVVPVDYTEIQPR